MGVQRANSLGASAAGPLARLARIGALASDPEELRLRKSVLVLFASLSTSLSFVWVITYGLHELWLPAAIPFVYQLASLASIVTFARRRRYKVFRRSQLWMSLMLPFLLQWSLGGFTNSSAVCIWAFTSPLGALLFVGARQAMPWFGAFIALVAVSAAIDPALVGTAGDLPGGVRVAFFGLNIFGVSTTAYALLQYFVRSREREQERSERLLLNVLPAPVAARLKEREEVIADHFDEVTVLFADIVGFTPLSESLTATQVVSLLDRIFASWDELTAEHGLEKIKTIGDAYMVAGGIPLARPDHADAIARMALAMGPAVERVYSDAGAALQVRIGIDSGPVVAGVIGRAKFSYDLWGDTVNTASRMESHARPGMIQVTKRAMDRLQGGFDLRPRGTIDVKGKGPMETYELLRLRRAHQPSAIGSGRRPTPTN